MQMLKVLEHHLHIVQREIRGINIDLLDGEKAELAEEIAENVLNTRRKIDKLHDMVTE